MVCLPIRKMEPTEVNANRFAGVAGGQILLDDTHDGPDLVWMSCAGNAGLDSANHP
jgi:hypothetical protein